MEIPHRPILFDKVDNNLVMGFKKSSASEEISAVPSFRQPIWTVDLLVCTQPAPPLFPSISVHRFKKTKAEKVARERDGSRRDVDGIRRGGMLLARGAPVGGLRSLCRRLLRALPLLRQPQAPLPPTTHPPAQEAPCLRPSFLPTFSPSPWRRPPPPTFRFRFSPLIPLRPRPPALWVIFLLLTIPGRQPLVDAPACRFYPFRPLPLLPRLRWTRFPPRADG